MDRDDKKHSGGDKFDDRPKETVLLSGHVAQDSITDDQQAVRYEPKFKSFSVAMINTCLR